MEEQEQAFTPVEELWLRAIYRQILSERKPGIHVTDLTRDCLRSAYYEKMYPRLPTLEEAYNFFLGKLFDAVPLLPEPAVHQHVQMEWHSIFGEMDEYHPTMYDGWLIEKKVITKYSAWKWMAGKYAQAKPDHVTQVWYYSTMATQLGWSVKRMSICYIYPQAGRIPNSFLKPFEIPMPKDDKKREEVFQEITFEMLKKQEILQAALDGDTPPPRCIGWRCGYDKYAGECFSSAD